MRYCALLKEKKVFLMQCVEMSCAHLEARLKSLLIGERMAN